MTSVVRRLQKDVLDSNKSVTELLRTAKVISAKLDLHEISGWLDRELNGYGQDVPPEYRRVKGGSLQVFNPVRGWQTAGHIDTSITIPQSVTELEDLAKGKTLAMPIKNNYPVTALIGDDNLAQEFRQQLVFSNVQFKRIIEAIKEQLLNWTIELEKRGILGEDTEFGDQEHKAAVNQVFNIQKVIGVAGNVTNSAIHAYDYSAIHATLKERGVPQDQRNELENMMDEMQKAHPDQKRPLLEKAKHWIVKNKDFLGASAEVVRKALGLESK